MSLPAAAGTLEAVKKLIKINEALHQEQAAKTVDCCKDVRGIQAQNKGGAAFCAIKLCFVSIYSCKTAATISLFNVQMLPFPVRLCLRVGKNI